MTRAARIVSGSASHRRVEPSTSVNRKVTIPEGGPPGSAAIHAGCHSNQFSRGADGRRLPVELTHSPTVWASSGLSRPTINGSALVKGKSGSSSMWVSNVAASTLREYALADVR